MADTSQWFVHKGQKVYGPLSSRQLKKLADGSQIRPDTNIRKGDDGSWGPASKVKGLFAVAAPAQAVGPSEASQPVSTLTKANQGTAVAERSPCPYCGEEIANIALKCRFCNEFLDGRRDTQQCADTVPVPIQQPTVNVSVNQETNVGRISARWSPVVAVLLSFIVPGLGQFYKGQLLNGLVWFVVVVIGYVSFIIPGIVLHLCCLLGAGMGDPHK